jgi:hypothetical protein
MAVTDTVIATTITGMAIDAIMVIGDIVIMATIMAATRLGVYFSVRPSLRTDVTASN